MIRRLIVAVALTAGLLSVPAVANASSSTSTWHVCWWGACVYTKDKPKPAPVKIYMGLGYDERGQLCRVYWTDEGLIYEHCS